MKHSIRLCEANIQSPFEFQSICQCICHFSLKKMLKAQSIKSQEVHYIEYFLKAPYWERSFSFMVLSSYLLPASYIANPLQVQWRWRPREIVGNCRGGKRCQILKRQREEPDSCWVLEVWTGAEGSGAPGIEGRIIGDRLRRDEGREQSDPAGERERERKKGRAGEMGVKNSKRG